PAMKIVLMSKALLTAPCPALHPGAGHFISLATHGRPPPARALARFMQPGRFLDGQPDRHGTADGIFLSHSTPYSTEPAAAKTEEEIFPSLLRFLNAGLVQP